MRTGHYPAFEILQFLHVHPWRCSREISEALGMNEKTVRTTIRRLSTRQAIVKEIRGRWVEIHGTRGGIRELVCYDIAPIDIKVRMDSNISLASIPERLIQIMRENGGNVSIYEFRQGMPGVKDNSIYNALQTLIKRGVAFRETDLRYVRTNCHNSNMRQKEVFVYSLKDGANA
jgi:predicted transcriptional regulator of viral defense system